MYEDPQLWQPENGGGGMECVNDTAAAAAEGSKLKTSDEIVKHTESGKTDEANLLSTKFEEFLQNSMLQLQPVEELAIEQGMGMDFRFLKPPGYKYKIG